MSHMPGNPKGAGRKRILSGTQMLAVGAQCERLWREQTYFRALARFHMRPDIQAVRDVQEQARDNPRRRVLDSTMEDLLPIGGAMHDLIPSTVAARNQIVPLKRLVGARERIRAAVICWARGQYGVTLTPRHIDDCWDHFRQIEARTIAAG